MTFKEARENAKLTQAEVAKRSGLKPNAYQHYEAGRREPKATTAVKLAKVLGVTVEDLFQDSSPL